jgi:PAS domain-containing protein
MSRAVGFERRDSLARHDVEPLSYVADEVCDFLERAAIPMHIVASDGTVLWANRAELDLLGYTAEEHVGRNIADCHADRPVIEDILRRLAAGETDQSAGSSPSLQGRLDPLGRVDRRTRIGWTTASSIAAASRWTSRRGRTPRRRLRKSSQRSFRS